MKTIRTLATLAVALPLLAACGSAEADTMDAPQATAASAPAAQVAPAGAPTLLVYKSPSCGCCNGWIEHLEAAGFTVDARDVRDVMSVKLDAGVPTALSSCHTALVGGYFVEGHVPAEQVARLLAERPDIAGIGVPGMPIGSPGMEGPNARPYQVFAIDRAGASTVWAEVDPR